MLHITIRAPDADVVERSFHRETRVTFGRAPTCDVLLDAGYVSRSHGEFELRDGQWFVANYGTRTPLFLIRGRAPLQIPRNGRERVQDGDRLQVLHTRMDVRLKQPDAEFESGIALYGAEPELDNLSSVSDARARLEAGPGQLDLLLELVEDLSRLRGPIEILERAARSMFAAFPVATHFAMAAAIDGGFRPRFGMLRDGTRLVPGRVEISQEVLAGAVRESAGVAYKAGPGIAASMALPLAGSRGVSGVLQIDNRESGAAFESGDLDFAVVLAHNTAAALERAELESDIEAMFEGFVNASVTAIEARDPSTSGHSRRVAGYAVRLAESVNRTHTGPLAELAFTGDQLRELSYASLLHDFGKAGVAECLLVKANRLLPEQLERIESRFALIRAVERANCLERVLAEGRGAGDDGLARAEWLGADREQLAQRTLELVRAMNPPGPLPAQDIEELRVLASMRFAREDGSQLPWLSPDELAALCIPNGTLTEDERLAVQKHVVHSFNVVSQIPWPPALQDVPEIVHGHHERLDGSGYPRGLRGQAILTQSRLMAVADVFDALTASDRPFRQAVPVEAAIENLALEALEGRLDADFVRLFLEARVWEASPEAPGRPTR